jgi:hypothetical protein
MKYAQLDLALFHASAVPVYGSHVVESLAPPFGMKFCSMKRQPS